VNHFVHTLESAAKSIAIAQVALRHFAVAPRRVKSQAVRVPHKNPKGPPPRNEFASDSRTKVTSGASQEKHRIIG
jgi:hypothetical protein